MDSPAQVIVSALPERAFIAIPQDPSGGGFAALVGVCDESRHQW